MCPFVCTQPRKRNGDFRNLNRRESAKLRGNLIIHRLKTVDQVGVRSGTGPGQVGARSGTGQGQGRDRAGTGPEQGRD